LIPSLHVRLEQTYIQPNDQPLATELKIPGDHKTTKLAARAKKLLSASSSSGGELVAAARGEQEYGILRPLDPLPYPPARSFPPKVLHLGYCYVSLNVKIQG